MRDPYDPGIIDYTNLMPELVIDWPRAVRALLAVAAALLWAVAS